MIFPHLMILICSVSLGDRVIASKLCKLVTAFSFDIVLTTKLGEKFSFGIKKEIADLL